MIPTLPDCNNVLIVAPVSSGKSWLLSKWINSLERSVFMDITAESIDSDSAHVWHSPAQLAQFLEENPFYYRIAYHPSSRNFLLDFEWCVNLLWLSATNDGSPLSRWLIVDEVHELDLTEPMERVIRYARHIQLGFIGATQKFSDVSTLMRDNVRMYVIFHNTDEIECKAIRGKFGKEGEEIVRNLRPLVLDEVSKSVIQKPQCLVWKRGYGMQIFDLTDVDTPLQMEEQQCEPTKELPPEDKPPFSGAPSGHPENQSQEPTLETGKPA